MKRGRGLLSRSPLTTTLSVAAGRSGDRYHVLIVSGEDDWFWPLLDGLDELKGPRVTACSTIPQMLEICSYDPPAVVILDLEVVDNQVLAVPSLSKLSGRGVHLLVLADQALGDIGCGLRANNVSFLNKPVLPREVALFVKLHASRVRMSAATRM
jgi:DNA-binding response OmpR family regulator